MFRQLHRIILFSILLLIFFQFLITSIKAQQPVINSFSPVSGPTGTIVAISGSGFDATASNNAVYFGASRAVVQSSTNSLINVVCPLGASYDNITVTTGGKTGYSSKPFIVTFLAGNEMTPANMGPAFGILVGSYPRHHISCDIDGDDKPDLAIVYTNTSYMSVYRNTISSPVNITFSGPSSFMLPASNALYIAKGDIDSDGKLDLVVSNNSHNSISIFRNTSTPGNISFADAGAFTTAQNPHGLSIADYDADGKSDIAVVNINSNNVSIFRNTSTPGTISLEARVNFPVGTWPMSIDAADLDGDGKTEIAVTNYSGANMSVLKNTSSPGSISFAPKTDYPTGINPSFIVIGDLDADNKPDICLSNGGSQTISVFRNISSAGNISLAIRNDITTGNTPNGIALNDLDGDGKPDLVVNNFGGGNFTILKNSSSSGTISFAPNVNFLVYGNTNRSLTITDLDGDGKADITLIKSIDNILSYYQNRAGEYDIKPVCLGGTATLTSEITSTSYQWEVRENGFWGSVYNGSNYSGFNTANLTINNIPANFNYKEFRCMLSGYERTREQVLKTFTTLTPVATIQTIGSTSICPGFPVTLTSTIEHGGSTPAYQWKINGANAGSNTPSFTSSGLNNGDQAQLQITSNLSCATPATVNSNTLSFSHSIDIPIINAINNSISVTNPYAGVTYSWEMQDVGNNWIPLVPITNGISVYVYATGNYRVKAVKGSCTVYSNSVNLVITAVSNQNYIYSPIRLFPIPVKNELWIDSLKLVDKWEILEIADCNGRMLYRKRIFGFTSVNLNIENLSSGLYVVILRGEKGKFTTKGFLKI